MTSELVVPLTRAAPVVPGEEVDVAVEMIAPEPHGRYLGYWRLTGPHCRRKFGQRVWCHVQVVDPSMPVDAFDHLQTTLDEIRKKKEQLAAGEEDGDDAETEAEGDGAVSTAADGVAPLATEAAKMTIGSADDAKKDEEMGEAD